MSDRRFAEVLIYKGTDLAKIAELRQAADVAERRYRLAQDAGTLRGGDRESPQAAKDAHDAFVAEAAERAELVRIEALGRKQWRALLAEHPPRRVTRLVDGANTEMLHEEDAELGVNTLTLPDALLTYVDPVRPDMHTIAAPNFPTVPALVEWLDDLSGGDFDRLFLTAYSLNGSMGVDPKATTYSATPASSGTSG
jgi:hypothetical protein